MLKRYSNLLTIALAAAALAAAPFKDQQELIRVLKSDAPKADKAITCKFLAIVGDKQAVPALAPLLEDAELASWARIALESIPDPSADRPGRKAARLPAAGRPRDAARATWRGAVSPVRPCASARHARGPAG